MSDQNPSSPASPRWGSTTKLIVGLTCVAAVAGMAIYSRSIIGPLILAFILASLIQPIATWMNQKLPLSWRMSVNIIYLLLLVISITIFAVAGLAILQQAQSLLEFIQSFINNLPNTVDQLIHQQILIGPFAFDLALLDIEALARQLLGMVEPVVGQAGGMLGAVAASAATTTWWAIFILLVSYFLLTASNRVQESLVQIAIPGYERDINHLVGELNRIWGAFFRGQLILSLLIFTAYYILLTILGTRLSLVIAIMAGLAAFIPYLGPLITWTVTAIVAFLQPSNYFGLPPFYYSILVVGCCIALNQIFDNFIYPRLMGSRLGVHPAAILVAAIVATDLIGLIGLVLAAPVLATLTLLARYVGRKMLDLDPWPEKPRNPENDKAPPAIATNKLLEQLHALVGRLAHKK
jgi:predicted PurR-regulated permease PerM